MLLTFLIFTFIVTSVQIMLKSISLAQLAQSSLPLSHRRPTFLFADDILGLRRQLGSYPSTGVNTSNSDESLQG